VIVVLAFFILAVQVFVTILEFKLVTLAGFVLIPFAFFGRTAFMAERVLGHIISSGIKLLVLAVITGIGTTLFDRFLDAGVGPEPDIEQAMAIALGALTLLGLGIFGPSVANGIVAGGPQLGAGAAAGTAVAAGATLAAGSHRGARHRRSGSARGRQRLGGLFRGSGREERGRGRRFRPGQRRAQCGQRRRIAASPRCGEAASRLRGRAQRVRRGRCAFPVCRRSARMGGGDAPPADGDAGRDHWRPHSQGRR
jgi:type IV secretion system protein TrbL